MSAKFLVTQKSVRKNLKKVPIHIHEKIIKSLSRIQENPLIGVKLHGELSGYCKFRIGDYRILYKFDRKESIVEIIKIEHRQGVYK